MWETEAQAALPSHWARSGPGGWTRTQPTWLQSHSPSRAFPEHHQTHLLLLRESPRSTSLICPQGQAWTLLMLLPITQRITMTHFYILHCNCNPTLRGSCGGSYWGGPVYSREHEAWGGEGSSPHHSATGKAPGALAVLDLVPTTFPQLQIRPRPPRLPVQSQASSRLHGKPPSLPVTQPRGRLSPLLLFIGHDQAGVQDVLFWLPRAVPGRET